VDPTDKRRQALRAQADDLSDRRNEYGSGRPDGAKRRPQRPKGNSREAILRRLRRDHPALHGLVLNGELSPFAAAVAAGFRRRPGRRPKRLVDPSDITRSQEMELWLGAPDVGSSFASEAERRRLWHEHRDRLMQYWGCHGRRPMAWWCFEAPADLYYDRECERSTLYEAGLLSEEEQAELLKYWEHEFHRCNAPGFFICLGVGKFLEGEEACMAHYRHADIPATLVEAWQQNAKAERKR
jgi:hypothetical protein